MWCTRALCILETNSRYGFLCLILGRIRTIAGRCVVCSPDDSSIRYSKSAQTSVRSLHILCSSARQVLVAVHRIALFGVTLDEERSITEARGRAGMNLSVLKFGVHRFLAMGVKRYSITTQRNVVAYSSLALKHWQQQDSEGYWYRRAGSL